MASAHPQETRTNMPGDDNLHDEDFTFNAEEAGASSDSAALPAPTPSWRTWSPHGERPGMSFTSSSHAAVTTIFMMTRSSLSLKRRGHPVTARQRPRLLRRATMACPKDPPCADRASKSRSLQREADAAKINEHHCAEDAKQHGPHVCGAVQA